MKAAQTLRHHAFAQHVTIHAGLLFYTPHVNGPPTVAVLADLLHVGHVYAAMPVTPHGEHVRLDDYLPIEPSDVAHAAARDAENQRDDLSPEENPNNQPLPVRLHGHVHPASKPGRHAPDLPSNEARLAFDMHHAI